MSHPEKRGVGIYPAAYFEEGSRIRTRGLSPQGRPQRSHWATTAANSPVELLLFHPEYAKGGWKSPPLYNNTDFTPW